MIYGRRVCRFDTLGVPNWRRPPGRADGAIFRGLASTLRLAFHRPRGTVGAFVGSVMQTAASIANRERGVASGAKAENDDRKDHRTERHTLAGGPRRGAGNHHRCRPRRQEREGRAAHIGIHLGGQGQALADPAIRTLERRCVAARSPGDPSRALRLIDRGARFFPVAPWRQRRTGRYVGGPPGRIRASP